MNLKPKDISSQKGISLIIVFFVMTVVLSVVLNLSTILFNKIKIIDTIENSITSLYAAESAQEEQLYLKKKKK